MASLLANLFRSRKKEPVEELVLEAPVPERCGDRAPSFKDATVTLPGGQRLKAIAVDIDDKGARVRFIAHESLPPLVHVSINGICSNRQARIAWRDKKDAGLKFVDEA